MPSLRHMNFIRQTHDDFRGAPEKGLERIQVLFVLAILLGVGMLLGPTLLKKAHVEKDFRMKVLLRAFHTANGAYRQRNPDEGYAKEIIELVQNKKKIHARPANPHH